MTKHFTTSVSAAEAGGREYTDSAKFPLAVQGIEPSITIVVSFRERWRFTPFTIETIIKNTRGKYGLWLLDAGIPDQVRHLLRPFIDAGDLELIEVGHETQPNDARAQIVSKLSSTFAVFIDNDVIVSPGWLDSMVACAEETGAGIVCPLYLWGEGAESDTIHMAGGDLTLVPDGGGLRMTERHRHLMQKLSGLEDRLRREMCDFGEYHCLLMSRAVYSSEGVFDSIVVTVHEHIHASLKAKQHGYATWFEPQAQVNYLAFAPWKAGELCDFRRRWDFTIAERSLAGFAQQWGVNDDPDYRSSPLNFLINHVGQADLLDARPWLSVRREQNMTRTDLQQTFGGLEYLAISSGYAIEELETLANAYLIAVEHINGVYRPCARPFINHLAGTASVLLFYGCPMRHVLAGLLHALSGHGLLSRPGQAERVLGQVRELGSTGGQAAKLVQLFSARAPLMDEAEEADEPLSEVSLDLASLYLIEAANDVDMHLSFEVAVSGRADVLSGRRLNRCIELMGYLGLPGLASTLGFVREEAVAIPNVCFRGVDMSSFRFDGSQLVSAYS